MASKVALAIVLGTKLALAATTTYASRSPFSTIEPTLSSIVATEPSSTPLVSTSDVKGVAFDRIVQIWLENTASTWKLSL
jgi:acid phosphatase